MTDERDVQSQTTLTVLRERGEELERQLVELLEQRAEVARQTHALLESTTRGPLSNDEGAWLDRLSTGARHLPEASLRAILREVRASLRALEEPGRVAFSATEHELASRMVHEHFGASALVLECESTEDALDAVARGRAAYAVFPIESSDDGISQSAVTALAQSELVMVGERTLTDTNGEASFVRFAIVSARPARRAERNTTCLVFGVQDRPGALFEILRHFAERGLNLGKVQSRPLLHAKVFGGSGWDYLFYVEIEGHETDRPMVSALDLVRRSAKFLRVLGSYPSEPEPF